MTKDEIQAAIGWLDDVMFYAVAGGNPDPENFKRRSHSPKETIYAALQSALDAAPKKLGCAADCGDICFPCHAKGGGCEKLNSFAVGNPITAESIRISIVARPDLANTYSDHIIQIGGDCIMQGQVDYKLKGRDRNISFLFACPEYMLPVKGYKILLGKWQYLQQKGQQE